MTQSPEYPDLPWVPPKAWSSGRPYGPPLWIVIHTTEGSEGLKSAEDGAAYDARRTDGTSTHYMHDQDSTIQEVRTTDRANAAMMTGNRFGIHHELCGVAAQTPTQWHDAASLGTLRHAARQAARDAAKWGIPVRHLTVAQVRAREKGFCAHKDISDAFGESNHQDPGGNYPWSEFLDLVRAEMEDDVSWEDDVITNPAWRADAATNRTVQAKFALYAAWDEAHKAGMKADAVAAKVDKALAQLATLAGMDFTDEQAIAQQVLAGLDPAIIAAVIPQDLAVRVADELAARLARTDAPA